MLSFQVRHVTVTVVLLVTALVWHSAGFAYQPEGPSGYTEKSAVKAKKFMIAAANPLAVRAGYEILKADGSAMDAAIAAELVLGLVEPQSSGLGGGGYLLHWDQSTQNVSTYDGRSAAPAKVTAEYFLDSFGEPIGRRHTAGGRWAAVPGLVSLLEAAHKKHGKLAWKQLFEPAIRLATDGFKISPRLFKAIKRNKRIRVNKTVFAYFFNADGEPLPEGYRLINKDYAKTLKRIADNGARAFYDGAIAAQLVKSVQSSKFDPGEITLQDLKSYRTHQRAPICTLYRRHKICGMGPSSTGGLTVAMILGLLERFELAEYKAASVEAYHLFIEASRLAFKDRNQYVADPNYVNVPIQGLIDRDYLAKRSRLINPEERLNAVEPGEPPQRPTKKSAIDDSVELPSTTHLSVIDADGNAVSLTATLGRSFGSGVMIKGAGFLINSQMTNFSQRPTRDGLPVVNHADGGKRPRSTQSPTLVFNPDGTLRLVVGSPGGGRIINYVAKTLIAVLDWKLDVQSAISLPHVIDRRGRVELERNTDAVQFQKKFEEKGHKIRIRHLTSGLHGIEITPEGLIGGADPRREGIVMGE